MEECFTYPLKDVGTAGVPYRDNIRERAFSLIVMGRMLQACMEQLRTRKLREEGQLLVFDGVLCFERVESEYEQRESLEQFQDYESESGASGLSTTLKEYNTLMLPW